MVKHLKRIPRSTWNRLAIGLVLIGIFIAICSVVRFNPNLTLESVVELVRFTKNHAWASALFYVIFAIGVLAFPITIFPIVGGVLFEFWVALPLNLAAATFGAWMAYMISRFFGRDVVHRMLQGKLKMVDRFAAHEGIKTVFLLRWLGIPPFLMANYLFGFSSIKSKDFILGTAAGILPWMIFVTYSANTFWDAIVVGGEKGLRTAILAKMGPLMGLSLTFLLMAGLTVYIKKRKAVKHENHLTHSG